MNLPSGSDDLFELRLMVEELVCNVCRFAHVSKDQVRPQDVCIRQEVRLALKNAFADIHVTVPGAGSYFVEVKLGYSRELLLESLRRKYSNPAPQLEGAYKLVLIYDPQPGDWPALEPTLAALLPSGWTLELWDTEVLLEQFQKHFGVRSETLDLEHLYDFRALIEQAKAEHAFGPDAALDPLASTLLWQFSHWRLREIFERVGRQKRAILEPGSYQSAVVVFADLCGFSSYVRDTPSGRTIQTSLSAFCCKARYQVINDGGMLYQFLGDAVIGIFGVPDHQTDCVVRAFQCARALLDIGSAVSHDWQRQIDRLQPVHGAHIGMAMGDLQFLPLRPFSRNHFGVIGDAINLAVRLSNAASSGEIVVSNSLHSRLPFPLQRQLTETEPVEAKNVGRIKAWKYSDANLR